MSQTSNALPVWYWASEKSEYIVAAQGASDASRAFERLPEFAGKAPQPYGDSQSPAGRQLAVAKPGVVYRRTRNGSAPKRG